MNVPVQRNRVVVRVMRDIKSSQHFIEMTDRFSRNNHPFNSNRLVLNTHATCAPRACIERLAGGSVCIGVSHTHPQKCEIKIHNVESML